MAENVALICSTKNTYRQSRLELNDDFLRVSCPVEMMRKCEDFHDHVVDALPSI